ncbi:hypothetical protein PR202_gb22147 [Eleusine coracana subsp. coracana]|uniref:RING-type domain-containing protein n=1 Tax=Eleusine coracana subsp. coracana TaxID=191504 RepID=A0AAV5FF09_ELECO|nr:hypothetical protein QOZ80_6AG0540740 [Eleusine coracana subsp. coracana]GJN33536.1 hypothetical protein PR202_gb22147 [Eleusine coracana subsp. coracana]
MEAPRPGARRGVTLAEQLAASSNLRDLLKLRDDDDHDQGSRRRRSTLLDAIHGGAAAAADRPPAVVVVPTAARAPRERVSLMALLERTEQQWTACNAATGTGGQCQWKKRVDGEEEEEEEEQEEQKGVGGRCCVCVARGKGAAFIPCGHTFCRACARDLRDVLNLF